jgi:ABC-type phosphate/phosphonate transport system substrate-binding protein
MRRRRLPALVLVAAWCLTVGVGARSDPPIPFAGFPIDDDTIVADRLLATYLAQSLGRRFDYSNRYATYGDLVQELTIRRDAYVARMTPYSFIAARMLGAEFEVLATYESATTHQTTYHSYFVVNAERFANRDRTLEGLKDFIRQRSGGSKPARFVFHDEFSTSGYFVPALWLRNNHVFATDRTTDRVARIEAPPATRTSSTEVAAKVAVGEADFAAVWDGTKAKFTGGDADLTARFGKNLVFIPLPNLLPNDLLVASSAVDESTRDAIVAAITAMRAGAIAKGDFDRWVPIGMAMDALEALASLNRAATAPPAPVVVRVQAADAASRPYVDDVRQAVRLSGTEFVLEVPKFHDTVDVLWTVTKVHDGAIVLSTAMVARALQDITQQFQLSFTSATGDLTKRVVSLIHSRMHRVRYLWPYNAVHPTVIRDVDFTLQADSDVAVQRITWRDPDRNDFLPGRVLQARVVAPDAYKFTFDVDAFRTETGGTDFQNPLSNVAYRVVLRRDSVESTRSKVLTITFLSVLLLAAAAAATDLWRRTSLNPAPARRSLPDVCVAHAKRQHEAWLCRTLKDADLLCCERERVETLIADFKQRRVVPGGFGRVASQSAAHGGAAAIAARRGGFGRAVRKQANLIADPERVSDPVRLDALLDLLIRRRMLSSFVGRPLEWDALNELAREALDLPAGESHRAVDATNPDIIDGVSRHFNHVVQEAMQQVCFFGGLWKTTGDKERQLARRRVDLAGPLWFGKERVAIKSLVLEFNMPADVASPPGSTLDCWILGKIVRATVHGGAAGAALCLHLRTVAVILSEFVGPAQVSETAYQSPSRVVCRDAAVGV